MNTSKILTGILFIGLAVGCYKDKGNYDYKQVNNFKIVLSPESTTEDNNYTVNQPADTSYFTLTANVEQTLESGKDNLAFEWISERQVKEQISPLLPAQSVIRRDTVYTEDITLDFPPGKETTYNLMCRVKDLITDIEYYKSVTVKTQVPFHDAWLLVHGNLGERKLGAIEWDVDGNMRWTADILETMGQQAFPYLTSVTYTPKGYAVEVLAAERLLLTSTPDSSFAITPFDCKTMNTWNTMCPVSRPNVKINGKIFGSDVNDYMGFVDEDGRFFWGRAMGYFYEAGGSQVSGYHVDKFYINKEGYATLWDNQNKQFMYYNFGDNKSYAFNIFQGDVKHRQDQANTANIAYLDVIPTNEMQDKEILYAGRGTKSVSDQEETSLFIVTDGARKCYLYEFSYNSKNKAKGDDNKGEEETIGNVTRDTLNTLSFDEHTLFATSDAYNEQLFYAQNNQLFRVILHTEENINLHNVDGTIKQIAFRISNQAPMPDNISDNRIIGLVVQKANGMDEFQEVYLDTAGDVTDVKVYSLEGVTSIVDFTYTNVNRVFK